MVLMLLTVVPLWGLALWLLMRGGHLVIGITHYGLTAGTARTGLSYSPDGAETAIALGWFLAPLFLLITLIKLLRA